LRYGEVEDEVKGTTFKHRIAEIHATSMKRLSKIEPMMIPQTEPATSNRPGSEWMRQKTVPSTSVIL
jgi:hypothetical protein